MRAQTIQLQNEDGSHSRWITPGEAERMQNLGQIRRVTSRKAPTVKYRMNARVEPSNARSSMTSVTQADLRVLVGIQRASDEMVERLIGFGLLPEGTMIPANGFLGA
jgi:hypothetical protein